MARKYGTTTDDVLEQISKSLENGSTLGDACKPFGMKQGTARAALKRKGLPTCSPKMNRSRICEAFKERWKDPNFRDKAIAALRVVAATPEFRAMRSRVASETWADPTIHATRTQSAFEAWADPEKAARITAGHNKPGVAEAKAAAQKAAWADPVKRAARIEAIRASKRAKINLDPILFAT